MADCDAGKSFADEVELKKKRLLEELESVVLLPKDDSSCAAKTLQLQQSLGLGIEVIDDTALVETLPSSSSAKATKKEKNSRRRGAAAAKKRSVAVAVAAPRKYSRKEMEALRFLNAAQQRKFWKSIYGGLEAAVATEYDSLASTHHRHHHHHQCLPSKKQLPPVLSVGAASGRWRYMNVFVH